jgi:hypothetical protein
MTAIDLRTEIKRLVDMTDDAGFLEAIKTLLIRSVDDKAVFEEMNKMADRSDEAISKGEVFTHDEVLRFLSERRT